MVPATEVASEINKPHFDQGKFLEMVKWHRITPQVYQSLVKIKDDLPAGFFEKLERKNKRCRMKSLKMSAWLANISQLLNAQEIDFISLKGIGLSKQLYGETGYRQCRDIDIMVEVENVDATEEILYSLGFERVFPHMDATPKQIHCCNIHKKDRIYSHAEDGTILELHWRLTEVDHPFKPSLQQLLATACTVSVHGEEIRTVSGAHLWLYECLHGSYSGWYRLRWVCDIALLLKYQPPDWSKLLELADRYHCTNSLLEAVGLTCAIFDMQIPEPLQPLLEKNSRVQKNIDICGDYLFYMKLMRGVADLRRIRFWAPTKSFIRHLLTLGPINVSDFNRVKLPDGLFFVYYFLRPFSSIFRRIARSKRITP